MPGSARSTGTAARSARRSTIWPAVRLRKVSVALAANHSNSTLPLVYRITAVWGNHEGSILLWSLILSCLGLFAAGALASQVTARSWWFSGLRQLLVGAAAAAVTYGVGTLVGTAVG